MKLYKPSVSGDRELYLGEINNAIYSRRVREKHTYSYKDYKTGKTTEGWTIDKDACEQTVFNECTYILIKNTDNKKNYMISIQSFMQQAIPLRDRYFLAKDKFEVLEDHQPFKRIEVIKREK